MKVLKAIFQGSISGRVPSRAERLIVQAVAQRLDSPCSIKMNEGLKWYVAMYSETNVTLQKRMVSSTESSTNFRAQWLLSKKNMDMDNLNQEFIAAAFERWHQVDPRQPLADGIQSCYFPNHLA